MFALLDMSVYSGAYLRGLRTGGIHYYSTVPVAAPGPIFADAASSGDTLTLAGYQLANGYVGLEPQGGLASNDSRYLKALGVTAELRADGSWFLPANPLAPIRLALPFYSQHPVEAMEHVDLTKMAVVNEEVMTDSGASGFVQIIAQHPGFIHITAQSFWDANCA